MSCASYLLQVHSAPGSGGAFTPLLITLPARLRAASVPVPDTVPVSEQCWAPWIRHADWRLAIHDWRRGTTAKPRRNLALCGLAPTARNGPETSFYGLTSAVAPV